MKSISILFLLVFTLSLFWACEKKTGTGTGNNSFINEDRSQIIGKTRDYIVNVSSTTILPVDYNLLLEFIPREFEGAEPEKIDARTVSILNMKSTYAEGFYNFPDKSSIEVHLVDIAGNTKHPAFISFNMLILSGIEEDGINGYKRVVEIGEFPGYREFRSSNSKTDLCALIGERIIVKLVSIGIEEEKVDKFIKKLNLKKLSEIK